jgi:hypothetical protein
VNIVPLTSARPSFSAGSSGSSPAADQRLAQMALGDQVAAGGERALDGHDRRDAVVEQAGDELDELGPDGRETLGEHVGLEQQHAAHEVVRARLARAGRVARERVALHLADVLGRERVDAVGAVARVHAVHPHAGVELAQERLAVLGHARACRGRDLDARRARDDGVVVLQRERPRPQLEDTRRGAGERHRHDRPPPTPPRAPPACAR